MKEFEKIARGDPEYPSLLTEIPGPPEVLYWRGKIEEVKSPSIALVGCRAPTPYGERVAWLLSEELAKMGVTTVSGLARGIDTVVHEATLKAGGKTIAVLGTGMDLIYPSENKNLAAKISQQGVVVTEFPPGTLPLPHNFPQRNRIISGLSLGTVVIEAAEKSGALITARLAAEQGREVFAVPGPITSPVSRGPNRLIRDGAKLAQRAEDILEEIPRLAGRLPEMKKIPAPGLTKEEQDLLNLISHEPVLVDKIIQGTGRGAGTILQSLLDLELKGAVRCLPGKRYVRN